MKTFTQVFSWLALAATLLPSLLFFAGRIDLPQVKTWMLVATIAWFVTTPFWMEHKAGD